MVCNKDAFIENYWYHIAIKQKEELEKRYYGIDRPLSTILEDVAKTFGMRNVIPFADVSLGTCCTLKCKDCTQWIPYMRTKIMFSQKDMKDNLDKIFETVDYLHFFSAIGGEPFLNPELSAILDLLKDYCVDMKIGFVRFVTNGTVCPSDEVIRKIAQYGFFVLVSDYDRIFTENQRQTKEKLLKAFDKYDVRYHVAQNFIWTDLGSPAVRNGCTHDELVNTFSSCFIKNCVGLYGTKLYHCHREYVLDDKGDICAESVIDFATVSGREEVAKRLVEFYSRDYLNSCSYCKSKSDRKSILPCEQLK